MFTFVAESPKANSTQEDDIIFMKFTVVDNCAVSIV